MSKIEVGQFSTMLRRYLGMKGVSDVTDELAPEISATLVLEQERPEWEFLKGARLHAWAGSVPALAANFGAARLRNPAGSGMVAIVNYCNVGAGVGVVATATFGLQTADQATVSGTANRDGRLFPPTGGALVASFGYAALGGNAIDTVALAANSPAFPLFRGSAIVITPGSALNLGLSTANVDFFFSFHWLEKRIDELELR